MRGYRSTWKEQIVDRKRRRVLIVDDDRGMTETLRDILLEMGHDVRVALCGLEALRLVREWRFDIAFIDIRMPGMNGVETLRRVKEILPDLRVVMMTAYALGELIDEARREGAEDILYKPLQIDKMKPLLETG